jgi:hypothetical protein
VRGADTDFFMASSKTKAVFTWSVDPSHAGVYVATVP